MKFRVIIGTHYHINYSDGSIREFKRLPRPYIVLKSSEFAIRKFLDFGFVAFYHKIFFYKEQGPFPVEWEHTEK